MSVDLRLELRSIRAGIRELLASSRTARFAWTGEAATLQYKATARGQKALERLEEIEPELLKPKTGSVDAAAVRAVRAAIEAVEWDRLDDSQPVRSLVDSVEALLRTLPRAAA